jgi:hypothetical protein
MVSLQPLILQSHYESPPGSLAGWPTVCEKWGLSLQWGKEAERYCILALEMIGKEGSE